MTGAAAHVEKTPPSLGGKPHDAVPGHFPKRANPGEPPAQAALSGIADGVPVAHQPGRNAAPYSPLEERALLRCLVGVIVPVEPSQIVGERPRAAPLDDRLAGARDAARARGVPLAEADVCLTRFDREKVRRFAGAALRDRGGRVGFFMESNRHLLGVLDAVAQRAVDAQPRLLGISTMGSVEGAFAVALARRVRALAPDLPIVLGGDLTDEDLFAAFADDGVTVRVGKGSRKTHAHYMLKSPAEVADWLAEIEKLWREKGQGTGS